MYAAVQSAVAADKRKRFDWAAALGCPPGTGTVRIRVKVSVTGGNQRGVYQFSDTTEVAANRRLADQINAAINHAEQQAAGFGYQTHDVTSADLGSRYNYSIETVECS